jgi:hypothetical protein
MFVVSQAFCFAQATVELVRQIVKTIGLASITHGDELRMEQIPIRHSLRPLALVKRMLNREHHRIAGDGFA